MTPKHRVLRSIETDDGGRCVDLFVRADGSFGFEEYRRDTEDRRGWFAIGHFAARSHPSERAAIEGAQAAVVWLAEAMGGHH